MAGSRTACADFTDARRSPGQDVDYSLADIGLSALFLFFMQTGSFLPCRRWMEQGRSASNCHTLCGMKKILLEGMQLLEAVQDQSFPCVSV